MSWSEVASNLDVSEHDTLTTYAWPLTSVASGTTFLHSRQGSNDDAPLTSYILVRASSSASKFVTRAKKNVCFPSGANTTPLSQKSSQADAPLSQKKLRATHRATAETPPLTSFVMLDRKMPNGIHNSSLAIYWLPNSRNVKYQAQLFRSFTGL